MSLEIRQLQMLQLEIAKEVKRICKKNNINYFLADGSLLGAIRHNGFIPWDDDLDFGMEYSEYKKFVICCQEQLDVRFDLQTWDLDDTFGFPFAKIRLKHTTMNEVIQPISTKYEGIWVDIFPFLKTSNNAMNRKNKVILFLVSKIYLLKCGYAINKITSRLVNRLINYALLLLGTFVKKNWLKKQYIRAIKKIHDNDGDMLLECDGRFTGQFCFKRSLFESYKEIPFEDTEFQVPSGYEGYLEKAYDDYMQLPPESEREKGHHIIFCDLKMDYEKYFVNDQKGNV